MHKNLRERCIKTESTLLELEAKIEKLKDSQDEKKVLFEKKDILSPWTIISELLAGVIVGLLLGVYLDKLFGTIPVLLIICTILGGYGGLYNLYKIVTTKLAEKNKNPPLT